VSYIVVGDQASHHRQSDRPRIEAGGQNSPGGGQTARGHSNALQQSSVEGYTLNMFIGF
jgi:hypothetical protein